MEFSKKMYVLLSQVTKSSCKIKPLEGVNVLKPKSKSIYSLEGVNVLKPKSTSIY